MWVEATPGERVDSFEGGGPALHGTPAARQLTSPRSDETPGAAQDPERSQSRACIAASHDCSKSSAADRAASPAACRVSSSGRFSTVDSNRSKADWRAVPSAPARAEPEPATSDTSDF